MAMNTTKLSFDIVRKRRDEKIGLREAGSQSLVNHRTLSCLENGRCPSVSILERVCKWLGTHPGDYF